MHQFRVYIFNGSLGKGEKKKETVDPNLLRIAVTRFRNILLYGVYTPSTRDAGRSDNEVGAPFMRTPPVCVYVYALLTDTRSNSARRKGDPLRVETECTCATKTDRRVSLIRCKHGRLRGVENIIVFEGAIESISVRYKVFSTTTTC